MLFKYNNFRLPKKKNEKLKKLFFKNSIFGNKNKRY